MKNKIFICIYCKKEFTIDYKRSSQKFPLFCCKSCATKFQRNGSMLENECIEFIKDKILNCIKRKKRYMTKDEILKECQISSKTISRHKLSIIELNKLAGFKKPKSVFQFIIQIYLEKHFLPEDIQIEKSFRSCISPKKWPLKFDFYIEKLNLLIEADGEYHKDLSNFYNSSYTQACDEIKNQWCLENSKILIRIPYKKIITDEYLDSFFHNISLNTTT